MQTSVTSRWVHLSKTTQRRPLIYNYVLNLLQEKFKPVAHRSACVEVFGEGVGCELCTFCPHITPFDIRDNAILMKANSSNQDAQEKS